MKTIDKMYDIHDELFKLFMKEWRDQNAASIENNDNSNKNQVQSGKTSSVPIVSSDLEKQVHIDQNSSISIASGDLKDLAQSDQISSTLGESCPLLSDNNNLNQPDFWSGFIDREFKFNLDNLFPTELFDNHQYAQELKNKFKVLGKKSLYWLLFSCISFSAALISFTIIVCGAWTIYDEGCKK
ncbi:uncharacterized protein KGF55_003116 [Candida pseudojiufengensis]|uniref:uncharacterized protein n=1 Tax=Candida pseudojiufengensis TaxID=497109 RepID=UPI002225B159|nr:uncharacterized protein KGF55_003116 [Candida pseudojiufengensis]KAI5963324.1 hypothetical protein KGF55_003116 [Candida pseudojiufengensis]